MQNSSGNLLRTILLGGLGGLGGALADAGRRYMALPPMLPRMSRGKGRGGNSKPREHWYKLVSTRSSNPKGCIVAAGIKRQRKADKLARDTLRSHVRQNAHNIWPTVIGENGRPVIHTSLHPLYVNRG